jgi:hypothetical protein
MQQQLFFQHHVFKLRLFQHHVFKLRERYAQR